MPWATLELDPAAATERDVKRSYAKRLKTCRPDQDPEGFRRLHEAYTAALDDLQWREVRGSAPVAIADMEPQATPAATATTSNAVVPPAELPEARAVSLPRGNQAVSEAFERLELALKEQQDGVEGLVRACEQALYEHPEETGRWGELMHGLIGKYGTHPDLRLKPEAMIFELEHGGLGATLAIIERLDRQGNPQGIASLANLLLENKRRIAGPGAGIVAARLAGAAAFWVKRHSAPLADFAYEHLARGERDYHMHMIDQHVGMAGLLYLVPDRLKSYWRQRLIHTPGADAWDDEESREALAWLQTSTARSSEFYPVLFGLLPEAVAARVPAGRRASDPVERVATTRTSGGSETLDYQQGQRARSRQTAATPEWDQAPERPRQARQRRTVVPTSGGSKFPTWLGGVLFVMIIKIVALSGTCSNRSERAETPIPRQQYGRILTKSEAEALMKPKPIYKSETDSAGEAAGGSMPGSEGAGQSTPNPLMDYLKKEE